MAGIDICFGLSISLPLPKSMNSPFSSIDSILNHSEEERIFDGVSLVGEGLFFVGDVETLRKRRLKAKAKVRVWSWSMLNRRLTFTGNL